MLYSVSSYLLNQMWGLENAETAILQITVRHHMMSILSSQSIPSCDEYTLQTQLHTKTINKVQ